MTALYIHVPFCKSICPYCAFYKEVDRSELHDDYVTALLDELGFYAEYVAKQRPDLVFYSIFFGGGTPNVLEPDMFQRIASFIRENFDLVSDCEITMEMNPECVSPDNLASYSSFINRVSMGVQSFNVSELDFLGRAHDVETVDRAIGWIGEAGLKNLNLDLIYALPQSDLESLSYSLERAFSYDITHLSTYSLTIEPDTAFSVKGVRPIQSDRDADQYGLIRECCRKNGFDHYEVSAFSKPGFESKHNLTYWQLDEFIGVGPSASSYFDGYRYQQVRSLSDYIKSSSSPLSKDSVNDMLVTKDDALNDFLVSNLRLIKGFDIDTINQRFGIDFSRTFETSIMRLKDGGYLVEDGRHIRVTEKGLYMLDTISEELIC